MKQFIILPSVKILKIIAFNTILTLALFFFGDVALVTIITHSFLVMLL